LRNLAEAGFLRWQVRLISLRIWRALDGIVALMMWTMAVLLVKSLF
jgi:arginine exporter protein ArgO